MKYVFGVDIGGTTVKLGLFNDQYELLEKWEIPTVVDNGGEKIIPDVAASIQNKMKEKNLTKEDILGVGVGAPGAVNEDGFLVGGAVNLGWEAFDLKHDFEAALGGMTVKAGNDANVAGYGEMRKGGAEGYDDVVAVTLGTGVGGGVIFNGKIITGTNGAAGEIGHIHVEDAETEPCNCGNKGCLEQYASATGIARLAKKRLAQDNKPSVLRERENNTAKDVWDAVKAGDEVAIDVAKKFGYYLGKGLAGVANVANPSMFVIGGGVSKAGEILLPYIEPSFYEYAFPPCRVAKFALATLGNDAGIYGSAGLILEDTDVK